MSGYTPIFASIVTGTLYGRWPDIGLWPIVLAIADRHGVVDVTPHYLAGATGLPVDEVIACMRRFCEPDPYSRSKDTAGARLVLLDDHRDWGWKVVNHGKYRETARKQMQQIEATMSGRDAERKRLEREASSDVQRCPASPEVSSRDRLSDSDSDSDKTKNKTERARAARPVPRKRCPAEFQITDDLRAWAKAKAPDVDIDRETERMRDWEYKTGRTDWPAAWRTWMDRAQREPRAAGKSAEKPKLTWRPPPDELLEKAS